MTPAGGLRRLLAAAWLGLILSLAGSAAAQTPLVPPRADAPAAVAEPAGLWQRGLVLLHDTQRDLHRQLAAAVRGLKGGGAAAGGLLIALSLAYGVFHAVGPGHGKAVISAYLLANEQAVRRGVLLAFLASAVQGVSAVALVGVLAILLGLAGVTVRNSVGTLESASYALVAAVGLWLLVSLLRHRPHDGHDHALAHAHGLDHHQHHEGCAHHHLPDPAVLDRGRGGSLLGKAGGLVLAVGIRPCSGAVLVLLFALAHGVFLAGVAATFAMALGTAVTVSVLAVLTLCSKRLALAVAGARQQWVEAAYRGVALLGAALLFLLGAGLFWASLGTEAPF